VLCVALVLFMRAPAPSCHGDHKGPHPSPHLSRPYGTPPSFPVLFSSLDAHRAATGADLPNTGQLHWKWPIEMREPALTLPFHPARLAFGGS
jgi:hypothetical protein